MAQFIIPDGVQVKVWWQFRGISAFNMYGARVATGFTVTQATVDALATAVKTGFTSSGLKARLATTSTMGAVSVRDVRTPNKPDVLGQVSGDAGSAVGVALPNQVAVCVSLRTDSAGVSFRGRSYIGGWPAAANAADGTITQADADAAVAWINAIKTAMTANGMALAILSPSLPTRPSSVPGKPDLPAKAAFSTLVTGVVLRDKTWDTQRRRLK